MKLTTTDGSNAIINVKYIRRMSLATVAFSRVMTKMNAENNARMLMMSVFCDVQ